MRQAGEKIMERPIIESSQSKNGIALAIFQTLYGSSMVGKAKLKGFVSWE